MQLSSVSQVSFKQNIPMVQKKSSVLQQAIKPQISKTEEKNRTKKLLIGAGCLAVAAATVSVLAHKSGESLRKTLKDLEVAKILNKQADELLSKTKTMF